MRLEKFFDPFAVFRKQSKKHFNQAQGEHAFGVSGRFAGTELGGILRRVPFVVDRFRYAKAAEYVRTFPTDACQLSPKARELGSAVEILRAAPFRRWCCRQAARFRGAVASGSFS